MTTTEIEEGQRHEVVDENESRFLLAMMFGHSSVTILRSRHAIFRYPCAKAQS